MSVVKVYESCRRSDMLYIGDFWVFNNDLFDYVLINEVERKFRRLNDHEVVI